MIKKVNLVLLVVLSFMFLTPGMVFAQTDRHVSQVIVSNITAEADGNEKVIVDIYIRDRLNKSSRGTVFISTQRGSADQFWLKQGNQWIRVSTLSQENGDKVFYLDNNVIQAEINGHMQLGISSRVKGTVELAVGLKGERELRQYLAGNATGALAEIIPAKYEAGSTQIEDKKYNKLDIEHENSFKTYFENKAYIKIMNNNNVQQKFGDDISSIDLKLEIIDKPANAKTDVKKSSNIEKDFREEGITGFTLYGDKPGIYQVKATVNIRHDNSFMPTTILEETISFELEPKVFGAHRIELFINSPISLVDNNHKTLEVAPFIQEGRTFVPVRFIAETLGADVQWMSETRTVVLSRADKKVTMNIGSHAVLLDTGRVIISDVAPFIKDNYTYLPFRVVAETFGAQVTAESNGQGQVEKVIFVNK